MFEFGKTFNMKSVWIWITNLKPYSVFKIKFSNYSNYETIQTWQRGDHCQYFSPLGVTSGLWRFVHHLGMLKILKNGEIELVKLQLIWSFLTKGRSLSVFLRSGIHKSYWNLTKQQIDETQIIVIVF